MTSPSIKPVRLATAVLASEWIKLRSLRSVRATLLGTALVSVTLAVLVCASYHARWAGLPAPQRVHFNPTDTSLGHLQVTSLFFGALGSLVVTNEYGNGLIRATFAATPQRGRVVAAKAVLFGVGTLVAATVTCLVAFGAGQGMLTGSAPHAGLGDPGVLAQVLGGALYLTLTGLFGLFLGLVARGTAVTMSALFGIFLVLPILVNSLPHNFLWRHTTPYLPSNLGVALWHTSTPYTVAPGVAALVLAGYVAALAVVGMVLLRGRDT